MTIDFGKLPIEKAFHLLAKVLPGFALLSFYDARHLGTIQGLFSISYLGYNTKLAFVVGLCFISGYALSTTLASLGAGTAYMVGYIWAKIIPDRHPYQDSIAPWRDDRWRTAYKNRYGSNAPENLTLISKPIVEDLLRESTNLNPVDQDSLLQKVDAINKGLNGAVNAILNDKEWKRCYNELHSKVLLERRMEALEEIMYGLDSDLSTSAVVILFGACFSPLFRLWWLSGSAACWLGVGLAKFSTKLYRLVDPWTTLNQQIEFLTTGKYSAG